MKKYCNVCGKEIKENSYPNSYPIKLPRIEKSVINTSNHYEEWESVGFEEYCACMDCLKKISNFVNNGLE